MTHSAKPVGIHIRIVTDTMSPDAISAALDDVLQHLLSFDAAAIHVGPVGALAVWRVGDGSDNHRAWLNQIIGQLSAVTARSLWGDGATTDVPYVDCQVVRFESPASATMAFRLAQADVRKTFVMTAASHCEATLVSISRSCSTPSSQ